MSAFKDFQEKIEQLGDKWGAKLNIQAPAKEIFAASNPRNAEILFVDDDSNNLVSFKANFRRNFNIHVCDNPDCALKMLIENPKIKIVISDYRLEENTGLEFLQKVNAIRPEAVKIIVTGYTDIQLAIEDIQAARIYKFIHKPVDIVQWGELIDSAKKHYKKESIALMLRPHESI
jgi:DNA-binding NtrC family response regulator